MACWMNLFFLMANITVMSAYGADELPSADLPTYNDYLGGKCDRELTSEELLQVHRSHRTLRGGDLSATYEIGLPRTTNVRNQCTVESCWAEALTALWEFRAQKAFGRPILLSSEYVLRNRIFEKANLQDVDGWDSQLFFTENLALAVESADRNGVIPATAFSARFPFKDFGSVVGRIRLDLNTIIAYHRIQLNQPEVIGEKVRDYLKHYFEDPPSTFNFDGRDWTSPEFTKYIAERAKAPTNLVKVTSKELGIDEFLRVVVSHIRAFREPAIMQMAWDSTFYDGIHALMTIQGFATVLEPGLVANSNALWEIAQKFNPKTSGHVFLAWDFETRASENTEIRSLLALNSWGREWGDSGYFRILKSYLNHAQPFAMVDRSVLIK